MASSNMVPRNKSCTKLECCALHVAALSSLQAGMLWFAWQNACQVRVIYIHRLRASIQIQVLIIVLAEFSCIPVLLLGAIVSGQMDTLALPRFSCVVEDIAYKVGALGLKSYGVKA